MLNQRLQLSLVGDDGEVGGLPKTMKTTTCDATM